MKDNGGATGVRVHIPWYSWVRIYTMAIVKGFINTARHFVYEKRFTLDYPFERLAVRKGYRGEHRLKKDAEGRPKCVACFMCQTACPAECITIVAGASPLADRDKVPLKFDIDLLKCIYCGMCEEACPCDAIELTPTYNQVSTSREEKKWDLQRLLRDNPSANS